MVVDVVLVLVLVLVSVLVSVLVLVLGCCGSYKIKNLLAEHL